VCPIRLIRIPAGTFFVGLSFPATSLWVDFFVDFLAAMSVCHNDGLWAVACILSTAEAISTVATCRESFDLLKPHVGDLCRDRLSQPAVATRKVETAFDSDRIDGGKVTSKSTRHSDSDTGNHHMSAVETFLKWRHNVGKAVTILSRTDHGDD
jgi:hypothetical protein